MLRYAKTLDGIRPNTTTRERVYVSATQPAQPCEMAWEFIGQELDQRDHIPGHGSTWRYVLLLSVQMVLESLRALTMYSSLSCVKHMLLQLLPVRCRRESLFSIGLAPRFNLGSWATSRIKQGQGA